MVGVGGTTAQRTDREDEGLTDAGGGDDNSVVMTKEAKTLMSGIIPNPSGTAVAVAPSVRNGEPTPQDLSDPVSDDDVVTTATPSESGDDGINHYKDEESCYDNGSNTNNELLSLRRQSSIITTPSRSDFTERCLYEDTFSFLIYSHVCSRTFFLAMFVFLFQIAIYIVLAVDIINVSNKKNPLKLPPGVESSVRIAEALAIVVAIITQDDVRKAVNLIRDGYNEELVNAFPGASKRKWILSIVLRGSEGLMGLCLTFLLIMQETTVIELLLNFLAMEFVSQLDDVVFVLTREGFTGRELQKEARKLSRTFYHVNHLSTGSRTASIVTKAYFIILFTIMFAAWGIIFANQTKGNYLCSPIFAQFSVDVMPMLGTFTGLYRLHSKHFHGRSSYISIEKGGRGRVLLAYCRAEKRWTLSLSKAEEKDDPCNWIAASDKSTDFDVLATANSQWIVRSEAKGAVLPLTKPFLECYDCGDAQANGDDVALPAGSSDFSFCGEYGECFNFKKGFFCGEYGEEDGWCDSPFSRCICSSYRYGLRCEYSYPCGVLEMEIKQRDERDVKTLGGRSFASRYYLFEGVDASYRPVYISEHLEPLELTGWQPIENDFDFILFTGSRWILSSKSKFPDLENVTNYWELIEYFNHEFHGLFTNYTAWYVSEPVQIGSYSGDIVYPQGLQWFYPSDQWLTPDLQRGSIDISFSCAACNEITNPCFNGAECLDGVCYCTDGYSGTRCEIPPKSLSDGRCDALYNSIEFDFDGGDCCGSTCRSTIENTCGKVGQGYIDTGYPFCARSLNQWELSGDPIYGVSSASRSGHLVALSGNGKILAVANPGVSIVRLFDKDGAEWKQRGPSIQGQPDSIFGTAISLSGVSLNIVRNPRTSPTVTLAVGASKIGRVSVYTCSTEGCMRRGRDIIGSGRFGSSLSIAEDGNSIAVGNVDNETISQEMTTNGEVKVFTWSNSNNTWGKGESVPIAAPPSRKLSDYDFRLQGYYVSLSGDYLAVGTLEGNVSPGPRFESVKLITKVFKRNESNGVWLQLGNKFERIFYDASSRTSWPLQAVVIKGNILAIGYKGSVDVYSWNETSKNWTQREVELAEGPAGIVRWSVDLSEDANILAIGTSVENPLLRTDESIRMYQWDGNRRYKVLSNEIPGGASAFLSVSSDGKAVAVGLPFDSSNGGSTRVYNFYPGSPCYDPSEQSLRISFTTDGNPEETTWELQVDSEVKLRSGSLSGHKYTTFVEEICVPATSCVRFLVNDTRGDGLDPPGVFALMLNGAEVVRGGGFGAFASYNVANCDGNLTNTDGI
mmetsp:Transcript_3569/g.5151  ORF Transcript_3569/g.5151 Transcript_3569/m.5151 type:complete len:1299 (+) Transcript_3569:212-4108(+)